MAEMLKDWLSRRLQRPISWQAEEFGEKMKNGHIIASILRSYYVINDDKYYLMRPSNVEEDVKRNWKYLKEWLRDIEIIITDVDLTSIMEGKGSTLLRLFYQLFLHLDKRDRTNFIKQERKAASKLIDKLDHRFIVERLHEVQDPSVDDLSKPILDHTLFIKWQRKKAKEVEEVYNYMRHKYSKVIKKIDESNEPFKRETVKLDKISTKDKREMEKFSKKYPCEFHNYTYDELLELEQKAIERKKILIDSDSARDYMDNLFTKIHEKTESEQFQKQLSNAISGSLWDMSVAEEESKWDADLAKKVMKLSQFEKQMCTQIMETKQQARNLIKNRIAGDSEFVDQRTQQFDLYLDNVKEEINLGLTEIDFEKQRQNMLHKKLYDEKMKRKRQHYYEICYETMLSILDFAVKYAYFKKLLEDDIPNHFLHEWKQLYYKQQPIFDILEPMENILKENEDEEEKLYEEHVIHLELDRQEALNESEFIDYHNNLYPWTLDSLIPNYDPESEERKYEYLGTRILGHVVYTLLEIKYPYPPQRLPANLPNFSSKAIVRGIPYKPIAAAMQTLLLIQKIHVVRLECAINYCLRKFKTEMIGCTDIELSYDKFITVAQEEELKELIKLMKSEDELLSKNNDLNVISTSGQLIPNVKQTQTPKTIPEEDISLSEAANLGRYAYECLNFGDSLTDHLICAIIVEYIMGQENINGFVIINYPNSYREAQILEETFSGVAPPDEVELEGQDDIYLEESIIKHRKKEKDIYKELRVSKLVYDPHKKQCQKPFSSYFTCYLKLQESEDILNEFFIWNLTEENSELIDRFYAILGINYSMYYEVIEKNQLALICKYIIGDYTMHLKSTDKLFGENVLSTLDFPSSDDKRAKSKMIKPESSNGKSNGILRRSSKLSRLSFANELTIVKAPESSTNFQDDVLLEIHEQENEEKTSTITTTSIEVKLLAGEEDWIYGDIPVPEDLGIALSTCWEEIEKNYVNDMQQLFLAKRLQMNCIIPYVRFIRDKMRQIITLPSHKQDLVSRFQMEYNDFENDWRDIHLTRNEWHCRIKKLQDNLFKICDERKIFAEQQKKLLICENWTMEELTLMANTYISCMQAELNRFVLTYQILHDFYFIMLKRSPTTDRLVSKELTKILRESDETSGSKKGGEDKIFRQLKNYFQDMQMKNIEVDYSNNPFNMIIENNVKFALKVIKDINDSYRSLISREYSEIAKIVPSTKKKEGNTSEESICSEEIFKDNALKCIEEWTMGINGEMFRASLRMLVLQYKCYQDMKMFNDSICKAFSDIQDEINNYYLNEIKSVDRLCKYLQIAVENGKRVPESLTLEEDFLIIDANMLQYSDEQLDKEGIVTREVVCDKEFKISQLARLRDQFKILAPTGIALQKAFIYLIQDFVFFGRESCAGPMFSEAWRRVDPEQIPKLVHLLFGETSFIDWRDFLIYCLNIPFPTLDELLLLRKKFRCEDLDSTELISRDKFVNEVFWFEKDIDIQNKSTKLRNVLIKHFLFELFETEENLMNYSAFLLAFCKGSNPIEGFVMALSMAIGKQLCYSLEECEEVICKLIKDKIYKDECLACAKKCAAQFLEKLLINVINICEGITITELEYTEAIPEVDKKGKKSKTGTKTKKVDSARIPKAQKSITSPTKLSPSTIDVQTTYICKPCEKDTETIEKLPEEEEIPKETLTEPEPDPNLEYAVSQSIIINVLNICLPWYFRLTQEEGAPQYMEQVEEVFRRLEDDTDNKDIYVSKFVSEPNICKLLRLTKKFVAVNLAEEISKVSI